MTSDFASSGFLAPPFKVSWRRVYLMLREWIDWQSKGLSLRVVAQGVETTARYIL